MNTIGAILVVRISIQIRKQRLYKMFQWALLSRCGQHTDIMWQNQGKKILTGSFFQLLPNCSTEGIIWSWALGVCPRLTSSTDLKPCHFFIKPSSHCPNVYPGSSQEFVAGGLDNPDSVVKLSLHRPVHISGVSYFEHWGKPESQQ